MFRRQFAALILLFTLLAPYAAFGQQPQGPQQPAPDANDENDMARFQGQLKGKIVMTAPMREVKARFEAPGTRRDEKNLLALANSPMPRPAGRGGFGGNRNADFLAQAQFAAKKNQFF